MAALPMRVISLGLAGLAWLPVRGGALSTRAINATGQASASRAGSAGYRQAMVNFADAQYIAYLNIGQQTIGGVLDTGSFELVVFGSSCYSCGQAAKYNGKKSSTYVKGHLESQQAYGSGDAFSRDASDLITIGPMGIANQTFWEVVDADMPVLLDAQFHAVVGVGPPETPAADAWANAAMAAKEVSNHVGAGIAEDSEVDWVTGKFDVAVETAARTTLLHNFGVSMFSVCIGAKPGSDGYFVWNDTSALEHPERFTRLPVLGKHTWTVRLSGVQLSSRFPQPDAQDSSVHVGCSDGCGAMIDSGTTLLVVPKFAVDKLLEQVKKLDNNCSNIQELPDLVFDVGDARFSLPPDAYVAEVSGTVPNYLQNFAKIRKLRHPERTCELVVMESSAQSSLGPLFILGVPFLRAYYTTFSVGSAARERSLLVSPASDECTPTKSTTSGSVPYKTVASLSPRGRRIAKPFWRRMDPTKLLVPRAVLQATTSKFMHL